MFKVMAINFFKSFKEKPLLIIDEIITLITAMMVSLYLAISSPETNFLIVYSLYFVNALTGLISAVYRGSGSIACMNGFYLIVNTIGLYKFAF